MGCISSIQRMSTHDGPGIRTTVFLKGCPLRCTWCHNPETISLDPEIGWNARKCIGCLACVGACPSGYITCDKTGVHIDRTVCAKCCRCAEQCPSGALTRYGTEYSPEELLREIEKDRVYFQNSGGGVTLSGGEPLVQAAFTANVLRLCKRADIPAAVDTCCYASHEMVAEITELADLMLIDIKHIDPAVHRRLCGVDNTLILENIRYIGEYSRKHGKPGIYIRTPLIPDCTLSEDNILGIGRFVRETLSDVLICWELLLFHAMCNSKYEELGKTWRHQDTQPLNQTEFEKVHQIIRSVGLPEKQVKLSGLVMSHPEENHGVLRI